MSSDQKDGQEVNKTSLSEILELLKAYENRHLIFNLRMNIWDDESGRLTTSNFSRIIFSFNNIDELIEKLKQ